MKHLILPFLFLLLSQTAFTQPTFRKIIGGPGADLAREDYTVKANTSSVPSQLWVSPVGQTPVSTLSTVAEKPLNCVEISPKGQVSGTQLTCDKDKNGEIDILTTCNCQFSLNDGPLQIENKFSNLDTGTYKVTIQSEFGCRLDTFIVLSLNSESFLFKIPNAFTPNGDALNERFRPATTPHCSGTVQLLQVYDRWGKRIFEQHDFSTNSTAAGWDGIIDGQIAPPDIYAYVLKYILPDGVPRQAHGNFTLLR